MNLLGRFLGPQTPPPPWAAYFKPTEWAEFISLIDQYLSRHPLPYRLDPDEGVVYITGGAAEGQQLGLGNLAQLCHINPRRNWNQVVENHFDLLFRQSSGFEAAVDAMSDFESAKDSLKVRIYPEDMAGGEMMVSRRIAHGIVAALVLDRPESVVTVAADKAEQWGQPIDALFELGLKNVRERDEVRAHEMPAQEEATVNLLTGESFFTATHALLLETHLPIPPPDMGALVAIPNRHAVLFHPIFDEKMLGALASIVLGAAGMFQQGPGSISPNVYWWTDGKLTFLPAPITEQGIDFNPPESFLFAVMNRIRSVSSQ